MLELNEFDEIAKILNQYVDEFRHNPLNFLYESDIRARIFNSLYIHYQQNEAIKLKKMVFPDNMFKAPYELITNPVKTEYPSNDRFDIGIIDNSYILSDQPPSAGKNENFWILPVKLAIELKFCQYGENFNSKYDSFLADLEKIKSYIQNPQYSTSDYFKGLSILFVQYYSNHNEIVDFRYNPQKVNGITLDNQINGFIVFPEEEETYRIAYE